MGKDMHEKLIAKSDGDGGNPKKLNTDLAI